MTALTYKHQSCSHIETSQLICRTKKLWCLMNLMSLSVWQKKDAQLGAFLWK